MKARPIDTTATRCDEGSCVVPQFLSAAATVSPAGEVEDAWQSGCFRHAGVGRGASWELRLKVHSDKVLWLDQAACTPSQAAYLDPLDQLRQASNSRQVLPATQNRYGIAGWFRTGG